MKFREVTIKTSTYTFSNAICDGKTLVYQDANRNFMVPVDQATIVSHQNDIPMSGKLKEELIYFYFSKTIRPTIKKELRTYQIELDYWLSSLNEYTGDQTNYDAVLNRIKELSYLIYEG